MDYRILHDELTTDPLARGYAGMTDAQAAADLNTERRELERTSITSEELWENTDLTEFGALSAAARQAYQVIVSLPTINAAAGSNSRTTLAALFPAGSTTRDNLVALVSTPLLVTRAQELGLGAVSVGDVIKARAYPAGA